MVATIPSFTLGKDWVKHGEYYYYTKPVAPNDSTGDLLGTSITLQEYTDADGGKQAIDVMAEAIQSTPASAVTSAWNVQVVNGTIQ